VSRPGAIEEKGERVFAADLDALKEENTRLQRDLTRALEERNRLLKKVSDTAMGPKKGGGSRVLEERLEGARAEIDRLSREKRQLDEQVESLHHRLGESSRVPLAFVHRLEEIVSTLDGSARPPADPAEDLEDPGRLSERFDLAVETLWNTVQTYNVLDSKSLRQEIESLKGSLAEQSEQVASRGADNERLKETVTDLETALRDAATEAADQEGKLAGLRTRLEELEEENRRLAKSSLKLKAQVKDLRSAVDPDVFGFVTSGADAGGRTRAGAADAVRARPTLSALALGLVLGGGAIWLYQGLDLGPVEPYVVSPLQHREAPPAVAAGGSTRSGVKGGEETAAPGRASEAQVETVRDRLSAGGLGPTLVDLPGGTFTLGTDRYAAPEIEKPARLARVKPFLIGRHEITFDQYDAFAKATGRRLPDDAGWGRARRPVVNVTWDDATAYARWLSQQTGRRYRLPTEAEWEYAMAGGFQAIYWWGNRFEPRREVCFNCGTAWDGRSTAPVGSLQPNSFGLYDMGGNAMEWVQDCLPEPAAPSAAARSGCAMRVARGGAYNKPDDSIRTTARRGLQGSTAYPMVGFRVVRDR
jgi:formylglycine-generating enzyme required for sulfatase activity